MDSSNVTIIKNKSLDYAKVGFDDIVYELGRTVGLHTREIQDFLTSSTGRLLAELFAASSEINFHYIQKALEESFLELAKNRTSVIAGARSMGYSIRRPTSSMATFRVEVSGVVNSYEGLISIPKFSKFDVNGISFISLDSYDFKWDNLNNVVGPDAGAKLIQGQFVTKKFQADPNKKFQKFIIEDESFSNYYGEEDPFYLESPQYRVTRVKIGDDYWDITRNTLLYSNVVDDQPYIDNGILIQSKNKKCSIQTGNNNQIEILFGDGIQAEIPQGFIEVTYLSTLGGDGNLFNAKDLLITYGGTYIDNETITFIPNTIGIQNLSFYLTSSVLGGDDVESIASIKLNAPKIFASLGKAVNNDDHIAILNTMPNVKYSMAYGEDDLGPGDYKYFNVVVFTVLKNLYIRNADTPNELIPATPNQYVFSGLKTYDVLTKMQSMAGWATSPEAQSELASSLNLSPDAVFLNELDDIQKYEYYTFNFGNVFRLFSQQLENASELSNIAISLKNKSMLTCRYLYIPPKVHKYRMKVVVFVTPITSKNNIKKIIEQSTFSYLRDHTRFNFPVYNSKIIKLIEKIDGVVGCHVDFIPDADIPNESSDIYTLTNNSREIFINDLIPTLVNINNVKYLNPNKGLFASMLGDSSDYTKYDYLLQRLLTTKIKEIYTVDVSKFKEKTISAFIDMIYANTLGKLILNPYFATPAVSLQDILKNSDFVNPTTNENIFDIFVRWAVEFRKDTNNYCAKNVIDSKGDISNYSIPHEIAQIHVSALYDIEVTTKIG